MQRLAMKATFCERVPMQLGSWDPDLSSATAYAWFFWMQPGAIKASPMREEIEACHAVGGSLSRLIPPGTCAGLTRDDDRVVYANEAPSAQMGLLRWLIYVSFVRRRSLFWPGTGCMLRLPPLKATPTRRSCRSPKTSS